MKSISIEDIRSLSVEGRIRLAGEIWDTIPASGETVPVSEAMREELDRRIEDHQREPKSGVSWENLKRVLPKSK